jgi:plastocyanin
MNRILLSLSVVPTLLGISGAVPSSAATVEVMQTGLTFQPQNITVNVGDTVRWLWDSGSHTVTSGDPGSCTGDGLFNEPLNMMNPTVEFTFNAVGVVEYYCIPHCGLGMNGSVTVEQDPAAAEEETSGAGGTSLGAMTVFPNPFNPRTTISFELPASQHLLLGIFDPAGRLVATLVDGELPAGMHAIPWDGRADSGLDAPSGIYYARGLSSSGEETARLILIQ